MLELTFGVDRNIWGLADRLLQVEGERTVWRLPPYLAPVPVAVFPLLKKEHGAFAERLVGSLRDGGLAASYDESGSIGRRYARMDEIGTPFCLTVDGSSVDPASPEAGTVTLRHRDSKSQERVPVQGLLDRLRTPLVPPRAGRRTTPS